MIGREGGKFINKAFILTVIILKEIEYSLRPYKHLINIQWVRSMQECFFILGAEMFIDTTWNGSCTVDLLACCGSNDLLSEFPHHHALHSKVFVLQCHTDDVSYRWIRIYTEKQVWRNEMEKM